MMHFCTKTRLFLPLLGLFLALAVVSRANGQVGSAPEKNNFSPSMAGTFSENKTLWQTTPAAQPLNTQTQRAGMPIQQDGSVQRANFETPKKTFPQQPAVPRSTGNQPIAARDETPQFLPPRTRQDQSSNRGSPSGLDAVMKTAGVLAIVLGVFCVVAWMMRKASPKGTTGMPVDVIETLGRVPLAGRQEAHLIRLGQKLLLINITTDGARTLTEITDRAEVDRLSELCRRGRTKHTTAAIRQAMGSRSGTTTEGRYE